MLYRLKLSFQMTKHALCAIYWGAIRDNEDMYQYHFTKAKEYSDEIG